jgi:HK97 family phage major capsid protein
MKLSTCSIRLKSPYRNKAVFVMNDATVKAIRKLKDGQGAISVAAIFDSRYSRYHPEPSAVYTRHMYPTIEAQVLKPSLFGDFKLLLDR